MSLLKMIIKNVGYFCSLDQKENFVARYLESKENCKNNSKFYDQCSIKLFGGPAHFHG
jgi:hypothetical protein